MLTIPEPVPVLASPPCLSISSQNGVVHACIHGGRGGRYSFCMATFQIRERIADAEGVGADGGQ